MRRDEGGRLFVLIIRAIGLIAIFVVSIQSVSGDTFYRWPVVGVRDGDTIAVAIPGLPAELNPVGVRARGVDTPESGGRAKCEAERRLGAAASAFTQELITKAHTITFSDVDWDKYGGRIDAVIWVDGQELAALLIAAGLARVYQGGQRIGWC